MTEVVTGEAVVLDVPCARFPSRIAALLIDLLIQAVVLIVVLAAIFVSADHVDAAWTAGVVLTSYVLIVVGYSTIFETLTRGRTPGKMAFGLRVISDDGGPVRFRQALVRALTGAIEIWILIGAPFGLITSILSVKGKRLGDMFAGTYVIQERAPRRPDLPPVFAVVPPPLLGWAQVAEASRLTDQTAEAAGSYLRRFHELTPAARNDLGLRIATAVVAQVSPPPPMGTPPAAYLAAVLAIRRQREQARLTSQRLVSADGAAAPMPGRAWTAPVASPTPAGEARTAPAAPTPAEGAPASVTRPTPAEGAWALVTPPTPAENAWTPVGSTSWRPGVSGTEGPAAADAPNPAADAVREPDPGQPTPGESGHLGFAPPA